MQGTINITVPGQITAVLAAVSAGPMVPGPAGGAAFRSSPAAEAQLQARMVDLDGAIRALHEAGKRFEALREEIVADAEEQLLDLAVAIARKVLMQEIRAERYEIEPILREAMARVPPRQSVVVHMNPQDWEQCKLAHSANEAGNSGRLRFVADSSVPRAGCVLETEQGIVESTVEDHLTGIGEALKNLE